MHSFSQNILRYYKKTELISCGIFVFSFFLCVCVCVWGGGGGS